MSIIDSHQAGMSEKVSIEIFDACGGENRLLTTFGHHRKQVAPALGVELRQDVVEEEHRACASALMHEVHFCELERHHSATLLAA